MSPRLHSMANNQCCRTGGHCVTNQSAGFGWCQLRKIRIHSEIAPLVFCHHWIKSEPSLPNIEIKKEFHMDRQLDFEKVFLNNET